MNRVNESQRPTGDNGSARSDADACESGHGRADTDGAPRPSPLAWVLLLPIHLYRWLLGPLLPPSCRFYPSCSAYAVEALTRHGAMKGLLLTLLRLLRCGPWHPGGLDPVPERFMVRAQRPGTASEE